MTADYGKGRTRTLTIRVSEAELLAWARAAKLAGQSRSAWLRAQLEEAALAVGIRQDDVEHDR